MPFRLRLLLLDAGVAWISFVNKRALLVRSMTSLCRKRDDASDQYLLDVQVRVHEHHIRSQPWGE